MKFVLPYDKKRIPVEIDDPDLPVGKVYEFSYSFQVTRWLQWLPDLQVHQDINANPRNGTGVAVGFRSLVTF